jgi:hypothetical protein
MKQNLMRLDPWQIQTYLQTSRDFEKIFNLEDPIRDKSIFVHKIEEFCHKIKIISSNNPLKMESKLNSPKSSAILLDRCYIDEKYQVELSK